MFKRFWWVFLALAAVGVTGWLVFPRVQPKTNATGAAASGKTPPDPDAARFSDAPEDEADQDAARRSSRHSTGELEKYQAEKRRLLHLNRAVIDQEQKVEERRKVLATIVRTKGIIYKGKDADYSGGTEPVEKQERTSSPDHAEEAARRVLDAQDYVDAKREFETDQKLLQEMKLKLLSEKALNEPGGR